MPVLFVRHGSPMKAIEDSEFSRNPASAFRRTGKRAGAMSPQWRTPERSTISTGSPRSFTGRSSHTKLARPRRPGAGDRAGPHRPRSKLGSGPRRVVGSDHNAPERLHPGGSTEPERHPVTGISLQAQPCFRAVAAAQGHKCRQWNTVHNLRLMFWEDMVFDWAVELDATVQRFILAGDHPALVDYSKLGRSA